MKQGAGGGADLELLDVTLYVEIGWERALADEASGCNRISDVSDGPLVVFPCGGGK